MSESQTLSDAVSAIEENAEAKRNSEKISQKVAIAQTLVSDLNSDVQDLSNEVEKLQFYREILEGAFGIEPPGSSSLRKARNAVGWDRQKLVTELVTDGLDVEEEDVDVDSFSGGPAFESYKREIESAENAVESDREHAKQRLNAKTRDWIDRLDSAQDLQEIIGEQNDEFANTIGWMRNLVTQDMFNPEKSASSVVSEWRRAHEQWTGREGLHGKEAFQQEYDLSDDAMDAIERLSRQSSLQLSNLDIEVISELKSVPELSEAVELSL